MAGFDAVAHGDLGRAIESCLMVPSLATLASAPMQMKLKAKRSSSASPLYDLEISTLSDEARRAYLGQTLIDSDTKKLYTYQSDAEEGWIICVDQDTKATRRYWLTFDTWQLDEVLAPHSVPASADVLARYFPPIAEENPSGKAASEVAVGDLSHYFTDALDFEAELRRPITPPAHALSDYFKDAPDFEAMLSRPMTPPRAMPVPALAMPVPPLVVPRYARDPLGTVPPLTPRKPSVAKIDLALAGHIFNRLANLHFRNSTGQMVPVPFHYPVDGCYTRAQMMAEVLTEAGYAAEKVFVVSQTRNRLSAETPYGADVVSGETPKVSWQYHIAPVIVVDLDVEKAKYVLDPSLFGTPVPIAEWAAKMSDEKFEVKRETEIQAMLNTYRSAHGNLTMDAYPANHHGITETHVNTTDPLFIGDEKAEALAKGTVDSTLDRMTRYAVADEAHTLAKDLREMLPGAPGNLAALIARIQRTSDQALAYFRKGDDTPPVPIQPFPHLIKDVLAAYPDALVKVRIKSALKIPYGG